MGTIIAIGAAALLGLDYAQIFVITSAAARTACKYLIGAGLLGGVLIYGIDFAKSLYNACQNKK